jgi:hypothetical protein
VTDNSGERNKTQSAFVRETMADEICCRKNYGG